LQAFQEADADDFFGRETLVEQLINRLGVTGKGQENRFLAVVGPSGSGKSSVDNTVRIWDAAAGDELLRLAPPPAIFGINASWSPDGRYLATSGLGTPTSVWRVWQSREELLAYARECCVFRELMPYEREQFGLAPDDG